jgi:hypothetical protein
VIVVMMCYEQVRNGFLVIVLDPLYNKLALVRWRIDDYNAVGELGNGLRVPSGIIEDQMP